MKKTTHLDGPPGAFKRAKFWVQAVRMLVVPLVGKKKSEVKPVVSVREFEQRVKKSGGTVIYQITDRWTYAKEDSCRIDSCSIPVGLPYGSRGTHSGLRHAVRRSAINDPFSVESTILGYNNQMRFRLPHASTSAHLFWNDESSLRRKKEKGTCSKALDEIYLRPCVTRCTCVRVCIENW